MTAALENVTLPDGRTIYDIPMDMSNSDLMDKLAADGTITSEQASSWLSGNITEEDVQSQTPVADNLENLLPASMGQQGLPAGNPESYEGVGTAIAGNMDIPGGIAGAIGGAKVGSAAGPWGVLAGTVLGGAAGTFGGEILSDYFMSENPDFTEATKNAAIGAGVEVATLGAANKFKTAMKLMGFNGNEIAQLWKTYTTKKPKAAPLQDMPVGSPESLQQTQGILEEGGGTLRAYQTGRESTAQRAAEGIGEVGILSGPGYASLDQTNAKTIATRLQELADESIVNPAGIEMGPMVYGIIDEGKSAARASYNAGLSEVVSLAGKTPVNPKWFVGQINNFVKSGKRSWGNEYSTEAIKLARAWQAQFAKMPTMSVDDMLAFQRKFNKQIDDMGSFGSSPADKAASRDLAILSEKMRTTTEALLKQNNKKAYDKYKALNSAYGEAMDGLLPKLNASTVSKAGKGDYESIAKVLEGKNPDQIEAFFSSIDTAYNNARLAGIDIGETTGVATAKQAKEIIKAGWLKNIFGDISPTGFDPNTFARLASQFEKPANKRAAKIILGDDWGGFKALLNAMSESTTNPKGFVGSLVLRSKEAQAMGNVAASGIAGMAGGLAGLAGVLLTPVMLGKLVTRPAVIRTLMEGNKNAHAASIAGKTSVAAEITEQTISAVMGMFSEEEQAEIRNGLRNP